MSIVSLHSVLLVVAVTHLVMASVMALFARHKIQYLSIASVVGIFGAAVACVIPFAAVIETTRPAMLHPGTLMGLMAFTFLQSIYADISVDAQECKVFSSNYKQISTAIDEQRQSVSGVDEDEEALDLVKFQNAYYLASKAIQTLSEMYDRLITQTGV